MRAQIGGRASQLCVHGRMRSEFSPRTSLALREGIGQPVYSWSSDSRPYAIITPGILSNIILASSCYEVLL